MIAGIESGLAKHQKRRPLERQRRAGRLKNGSRATQAARDVRIVAGKGNRQEFHVLDTITTSEPPVSIPMQKPPSQPPRRTRLSPRAMPQAAAPTLPAAMSELRTAL
ncbi:hypothetical protein Q1695_002360 [Nippostrongylus brasiliensis]|nr:hypothetical protein Q1695_002360 [Nippostrongylus brasiliensis]